MPDEQDDADESAQREQYWREQSEDAEPSTDDRSR